MSDLNPTICSCKPLMYDKLLAKIEEDFHLSEARPDIHMSDLIYCLRRAYYDKVDYLKPTLKEIKYFVRGIALQDAILKKEPNPMEKDGIIFSPDYWDGKELAELKTTIMGRKRMDDGDYPTGWLKQIAGYCYALGINHATLIVFIINDRSDDLMPPYRLDFTDEELEANWEELKANKIILEDALKAGAPLPCEQSWMCGDCRYFLRCKHETT